MASKRETPAQKRETYFKSISKRYFSLMVGNPKRIGHQKRKFGNQKRKIRNQNEMIGNDSLLTRNESTTRNKSLATGNKRLATEKSNRGGSRRDGIVVSLITHRDASFTRHRRRRRCRRRHRRRRIRRRFQVAVYSR